MKPGLLFLMLVLCGTAVVKAQVQNERIGGKADSQPILLETEGIEIIGIMSVCTMRLIPYWEMAPFNEGPRRDFSQQIFNAGGTELEEGEYRLMASRNGPLIFVDGIKMRYYSGLPAQAVQSVYIMRGAIPADIGN